LLGQQQHAQYDGHGGDGDDERQAEGKFGSGSRRRIVTTGTQIIRYW
jgi:hypothetical protein